MPGVSRRTACCARAGVAKGCFRVPGQVSFPQEATYSCAGAASGDGEAADAEGTAATASPKATAARVMTPVLVHVRKIAMPPPRWAFPMGLPLTLGPREVLRSLLR